MTLLPWHAPYDPEWIFGFFYAPVRWRVLKRSARGVTPAAFPSRAIAA